MKKNVLYIFHVSAIGGGSLCLLNLVKELDKDKFKPYVLLKGPGPIREEIEKVGGTVIIERSINTVPYNTTLLRGNSVMQITAVLLSMKKVKYWIEKTAADIVHINTMMMYPYAIPAYNLSRKVVIHIRENWPANENKYQLRLAQKIIKKYTHAIIAINKTSADVVNLPEQTQIIYDWIDFEGREKMMDFETIFGNDSKNLKVFLFVGGIQRIKGALEVVDVFSKHIKAKEARLLFVGCDTKEILYIGFKGFVKRILHIFNILTYSDKIKKIVQKDDRIVCIPSTSQVKSLFEQSYCTVVYPTFPHAIIPVAESLYVGIPVISARTAEALEYSNNGKGARLFELGNKSEFIEEFKYVYENEESVYSDVLSNSESVKELFSKRNNVELLNKLYIELVEN